MPSLVKFVRIRRSRGAGITGDINDVDAILYFKNTVKMGRGYNGKMKSHERGQNWWSWRITYDIAQRGQPIRGLCLSGRKIKKVGHQLVNLISEQVKSGRKDGSVVPEYKAPGKSQQKDMSSMQKNEERSYASVVVVYRLQTQEVMDRTVWSHRETSKGILFFE